MFTALEVIEGTECHRGGLGNAEIQVPKLGKLGAVREGGCRLYTLGSFWL